MEYLGKDLATRSVIIRMAQKDHMALAILAHLLDEEGPQEQMRWSSLFGALRMLNTNKEARDRIITILQEVTGNGAMMDSRGAAL